ncbi:MAG: hypothetical protein ACRCT8_09470 [Lacipirellulaceae bacterium]
MLVCTRVGLVAVGLWLGSPVLAQTPTLAESVAPATEFGNLAAEAKAAFTLVTPDELSASRRRLAEAGVALERLVGPESPSGAGWLDYLAWAGVQKQFAEGSPADVAALRATERKLASGAAGLERPEFGRVAEAIEQYAALASFAAVADQPAVFANQVDALTRLLDEKSMDDPRASYEVERRLELFEGIGRGDALVAAALSANDQANVLVEVSSSLLSEVAARPVNDCGPLEDCILGTRIRGTGATTGSLTLRTLPSASYARIEFALTGNTRSSTVGVNGPVSIRSAGNTSFVARKTVELGDRSFRLLGATASATTRSRTKGITKNGGGLGSRLVEKIASKRVAQSRAQADAIAGDHAEGRVAARLDEQLNERIIDGRRRYDAQFTRPLRQRRATPRWLAYSSSDSAVFVEALQAPAWRLGASGPAPAASAGDLSARVHQTGANNLLAAYLGGATLSRDKVEGPTKIDTIAPPWLDKALKQPQPTPADVEFKPWSLRFRSGRPVSVVFADGALRFTAHVARITFGDESFDGWDLTAVFKPEVRDGRRVLVRQGPVDLLPTGFDPEAGRGIASKQLALRANLNKALNEPADRLPQELRIDPVDLTEREGPIEYLSIEEIDFDGGWANVAWRAD